MKYMLDTNICIYLLKNKPEAVIKRFIQHDPADICISSITYAELCHGVENSQAKERNYMALMMFLSELSILSFDADAAQDYGAIRTNLQKQGKLIGAMDMLIAAHAKSKGLILVTNNTREFLRVDGLKVEDWVQG